MTRHVRIEAVLAFVFGMTFVGVLAYAALRDAPLQEQNFFLLRVIAALSSAAIAAVLPGFAEFRSLTTRVGVSIGGSVIVFILIWTYNPPQVVGQRSAVVPTEEVPALLRELTTLEQQQADIPAILRGCQLEERDPGGTTGTESLETALDAVTQIQQTYEKRLPDKFLEDHSTAYVELKRGLAARGVILSDALQRRNCTEATAAKYEGLIRSRDKCIDEIVTYLNSLHAKNS